jgi:hypothetical protein
MFTILSLQDIHALEDIPSLEAHVILHMVQHRTILAQVDGPSLEQPVIHPILPHAIPIPHAHLAVP